MLIKYPLKLLLPSNFYVKYYLHKVFLLVPGEAGRMKGGGGGGGLGDFREALLT